MGKILTLSVLVAMTWSAQGQSESTEFETFKKKWLVQAVLEAPFYSFYLGAPAVRGVAYLPNFAPRLGPRVVYKDFGATLTFSLPIPSVEKNRRGDSTQRAFVLNSYWHSFAIDAFYQRYRGFYVSNPWTELNANKPARYPQIPDAQVLNFGLNFYYLFQPQNYSLKAAFDLTEFQSRSGGSWLLHPFLSHFDMHLGSGFVPGTDPAAIPTLPNLASGRFSTAGAAGGYGYTYVRHRYFASMQGSLGPGLQYQRVQPSEGNYSEDYSLALKFNLNISGGWNYEEFVFGGKLLVDTIWSRVLNTQVSSSLVSAQLFYGRRF